MNLKDIILTIIRGEEEIYSIVGTVSSVDESKRVIDVKPIDGSAEIFDVKLQANESESKGVVYIPKKDSFVIVSFLTKDLAFVSLTTEIDKILIDCEEITFNGGNNGGLVNIEKLVDKINAVENLLNQLVTDYKVHTHNAPQAPSGTIPTTPLLIPFTGNNIAPITLKTDLEDTKIKH